MDARLALPAINLFMADVGGGLGPFLSTWLKEMRGWSAGQIGTVIAAGSLAGALLAGPAGAMVDRLGRPRLLLGVACLTILGGTLLLLPFRSFVLVCLAQLVVAAGGALTTPASSGLTLAVVGRQGFPRQQGVNEAANHAGNVVAALVIGGLSLLVGATAPVYVLAAMALGAVVVLRAMDPGAIDPQRMHGRKPRQHDEPRGATRALAHNGRLWRLYAVIFLFQLGNSAMLPLLGQRVVEQGEGGGTGWMSACVIVAQLTMIPVAVAVGHLADRAGRRRLLVFACAAALLRCLIATWAVANWWLVPIELLDGVAAATFSVAVPIAVADLTYGGGRTQTAMGAMAAVQAGGAALASVAAGLAAAHLGYGVSFALMAAFPALAIAVLLTTALDAASQGGDERADQGAGPGGAGSPPRAACPGAAQGAAAGGRVQQGATEQGATQQGPTPQGPTQLIQQGPTQRGAASQGAASQGAASQGAASQGAASQGAASQGAASQGAASQGAASRGAASQGAASQGGLPGSVTADAVRSMADGRTGAPAPLLRAGPGLSSRH